MAIEAPERQQRFQLESMVTEPALQFDPVSVFLKRGGRVATFERGQHLFNIGHDLTSVLFVTSGLVALKRYSDEGQQIIQDVIKPGDMAGFDALIGSPSSATAVALKDSNVISVPMRYLAGMMREDPAGTQLEERAFPYVRDLTMNLLVQSGRRTERYDHLTRYGDATARVASALLDFREADGTVNVFREDIAERAVTADETVSRRITDLRAKGIIEIIEEAKTGQAALMKIADTDELEKLSDVPFRPVVVFRHFGMNKLDIEEEPSLIDTNTQGTDIIFSPPQNTRKPLRSAVKEENHLKEEQKWVDTLSRDGVSFKLALNLLLVASKLSREEFITRAGIDQQRLNAYIRGRIEPNEATLEKFIEILGLYKNGEVADLLRTKNASAEKNERTDPFLLVEDTQLRDQLRSMGKTGEILRYLMHIHGVLPSQLAKKSNIPLGTIMDLKKRLPDDETIGTIAMSLDYDPHHPYMLFLLTCAENEREQRRKARQSQRQATTPA